MAHVTCSFKAVAWTKIYRVFPKEKLVMAEVFVKMSLACRETAWSDNIVRDFLDNVIGMAVLMLAPHKA